MPLWLGNALVELKMLKDADNMDKIIREQLKLTPRSANLAIRTRVLIFYGHVSTTNIYNSRRDWKLTTSLACSWSVDVSRFSSICSSRNVGLRGLVNCLAGVPGTLMALLRGLFGVIGTVADSRLLM